MKSLFYKIKSRFLTIFGDIRIYRFPFFMVYCPTTFKVKGHQTRNVMNIIEPGDIIMRSYDDYLDGYFIPKGESGCSHSGICIDSQHVVHAIAEGVIVDDIIDFCRADRVIIMRPACGTSMIRKALRHANDTVKKRTQYDFNFEKGDSKYYCHEFTASCYKDLKIQQISRKSFGFIKSPVVFLADSFYTNDNLFVVYDSEIEK